MPANDECWLWSCDPLSWRGGVAEERGKHSVSVRKVIEVNETKNVAARLLLVSATVC